MFVGLSWLLFWLLVTVFSVAIGTAALITGLVFIVLYFVLTDRPRRTGP